MIKILKYQLVLIIRIWDYNSKKLLSKISNENSEVNCIFLLNEKYLLAGRNAINIGNKTVVKDYIKHDKEIITMKTIICENEGELLVTQGYNDKRIKVWKIEN